MSLDSVTIVIRSIGERSESLCRKLILDQEVAESSIFIINEVPFSKAMKAGFEIGISENRPWTFCVDADVLLRPGSIAELLDSANKQATNVCEIQGYVLDKFFGGAREAGNHLFRTSLLPKVIERIPPEGKDIRPEAHTLKCMQSDGFPWHTVQVLIGLHDFEQTYEDIFRKCFVQAHKNLNHTGLFIPYWRSQSNQDMDYQVALAGFAEGIKHFGEVRIDKRAEYFQEGMKIIEASPKNPIDLSEWNIDRIEAIIKNWVEPQEYCEMYPRGMFVSSGSEIISRALEQYKWHRNRSSVIVSGKHVLSWLLIGAGKKLRSRSH